MSSDNEDEFVKRFSRCTKRSDTDSEVIRYLQARRRERDALEEERRRTLRELSRLDAELRETNVDFKELVLRRAREYTPDEIVGATWLYDGCPRSQGRMPKKKQDKLRQLMQLGAALGDDESRRRRRSSSSS